MLEQCCQELVKIHRSLRGDTHLLRRCAQKRCEFFRRCLGECQPGWLGFGPTIDGQRPPLINGARQACFGSAGEQAEGISVEINLSREQMKFTAKTSERVNPVQVGWIRHGVRFDHCRARARRNPCYLSGMRRKETAMALAIGLVGAPTDASLSSAVVTQPIFAT